VERFAPGRIWRLFLSLLYLAAFSLLGYLTWRGYSYYTTPLIARPRHPDYWSLKPGGELGMLFGIIGASLMILMLAYSARKRMRTLRRWGGLRYWLDLHIVCGVVGPLFIVLHSSFKVQGLVALSFWSMVAVALSGVLGRYLYLQIPRAASGERLSLEEIEAERERLSSVLKSEFGMDEAALGELHEVVAAIIPRQPGLLRLLLRLPLDRFRLRRGLRRYGANLTSLPRSMSKRWAAAAWAEVVLERRLRILAELQKLFHYWHVVHKPFAVVMYLFMIVHIVVATVTGYVSWGG
jgi:hypothetical protein